MFVCVRVCSFVCVCVCVYVCVCEMNEHSATEATQTVSQRMRWMRTGPQKQHKQSYWFPLNFRLKMDNNPPKVQLPRICLLQVQLPQPVLLQIQLYCNMRLQVHLPQT